MPLAVFLGGLWLIQSTTFWKYSHFSLLQIELYDLSLPKLWISLLYSNLDQVTLKPSRVLFFVPVLCQVFFKVRFLFLQKVHFRGFKIIAISFKNETFEHFIEFIPSLYCWHNFAIKPRLELAFTLILFTRAMKFIAPTNLHSKSE